MNTPVSRNGKMRFAGTPSVNCAIMASVRGAPRQPHSREIQARYSGEPPVIGSMMISGRS